LLPLEEVDFGAEGVGARIEPYRSEISPSDELLLEVTVLNPFRTIEEASIRMIAPPDWIVMPPEQTVRLQPNSSHVLRFVVRPSETPVRRARLGAALAVAGISFGIQAEALVTVAPSDGRPR
jgi:hypothetical protein